MSAQDMGRCLTLVALPREYHDHESTCTQIFHVMHQMFVLLDLSQVAKRSPLELREESVFFALWIEAMHTIVGVQNLDVIAHETGLK
jgi:hypothetical protein